MLISNADRSADNLKELLNMTSAIQITALHSCAEARRILMERSFDLIVINAPLRDESGENLARKIAATGTIVILVVKSEYFNEVSAICENDGVLTIAKPINKIVFNYALTLAKSAQNIMKRVQSENRKLKQKIEDIRIVDRAKYVLITHLNMSEQNAHRYIEKQSMDMRTSKRVIAESILKTYQN